MARHAEGSLVYAAKDAQKAVDDFWLELDHKCLDKGLAPGAVAISQVSGVQAQTIRLYRRGKSKMQVPTLQALVKALSPDIRVILKYLGYSDKEIRKFAKDVVNQ